MEKFIKIFDLIGVALEYIIILGGGFVGAFIVWVFLSGSEASLVMKIGGTVLAAIISIFVTAFVWKLVKILNYEKL